MQRLAIAFSVVLLAFGIVAQAATAADPAATAFVEAIYAHYRGTSDQAGGVPLDSEEQLQRYFEPTLTALIVKDRDEADKRDDVPTLDGDPFVGAQDWQIERFDIALSDVDSDHARAMVAFVNLGQPITVRLDLVRLAGAWKISDIHWQDESLRELLGGK